MTLSRILASRQPVSGPSSAAPADFLTVALFTVEARPSRRRRQLSRHLPGRPIIRWCPPCEVRSSSIGCFQTHRGRPFSSDERRAAVRYLPRCVEAAWRNRHVLKAGRRWSASRSGTHRSPPGSAGQRHVLGCTRID